MSIDSRVFVFMGFAVLSAKVNEYFRLFHCDISVTHRLA